MKRTLIVLAICVTSVCQYRRLPVLRIVATEREAIVLDVVNETRDKIVVLSPETPSRQLDEGRCTVIISTEVTDDLRPYAFTPTLESVPARSVRRFRAVLNPIALNKKSCAVWRVDATYAYVLPSDVAMFKGRAFEEFRQHVLKNQKLLSASAKAMVKS